MSSLKSVISLVASNALVIVHGTTSVMGGGKFANGAVTGAFVHMFKSYKYRIDEGHSGGSKYIHGG